MEYILLWCILFIKYINEFSGFVLACTLKYPQVKISALKCGLYFLCRVLCLNNNFSIIYGLASKCLSVQENIRK